MPASVVATVLVLQALHGLSDREAADAVMYDLRWKAACGVAVEPAAFHPSTFINWRRRLAGSQRPHRIFEVVRQLIIETGAVEGKKRFTSWLACQPGHRLDRQRRWRCLRGGRATGFHRSARCVPTVVPFWLDGNCVERGEGG